MDINQFSYMVHPMLAVAVAYPFIGIVANRALQTRRRRLATAAGEKSKIPPVVGVEHVQLGRWLTGVVAGVTLVGLAQPIIYKTIIEKQLFTEKPFEATFLLLMFAATIGTLVLLYRAKLPLWRGVFAGLSSLGLLILGSHDSVWRLDGQWWISHYYYGIVATILMIFSLAIVPEIYKDKSLTWRRIHIWLNCLAMLLFIGQGFTGTRDLLDIGKGL